MTQEADLVICDSMNIETYIRNEYNVKNTVFIAYGADVSESVLPDNDPDYTAWLNEKKVRKNNYYLIVGRFVPENNYETMIREYMHSHTNRDLVIITNEKGKFLKELETKLHFSGDARIKFVGTVYNNELLKKIRENAYGYLHGHEVGGTNPSLLEALSSTKLNLLLDVGFNREVGKDAAFYWSKEEGGLAALIDQTDRLSADELEMCGEKAKQRILQEYNWSIIGDKYKDTFLSEAFS